ncbi:hypothetical protein L21SP4_02082 [Kiritimatiella glycovorans]|uniref:Uncharacterized protein n=1 Tax=Kiritimatiella glycovorans TaxID=1307763 RepID=A0A0G3EKN2_9BACT|nr:hypothetical protein L21SP4_02082 [Kiritimatiella glycovorans]
MDWFSLYVANEARKTRRDQRRIAKQNKKS